MTNARSTVKVPLLFLNVPLCRAQRDLKGAQLEGMGSTPPLRQGATNGRGGKALCSPRGPSQPGALPQPWPALVCPLCGFAGPEAPRGTKAPCTASRGVGAGLGGGGKAPLGQRASKLAVASLSAAGRGGRVCADPAHAIPSQTGAWGQTGGDKTRPVAAAPPAFGRKQQGPPRASTTPRPFRGARGPCAPFPFPGCPERNAGGPAGGGRPPRLPQQQGPSPWQARKVPRERRAPPALT